MKALLLAALLQTTAHASEPQDWLHLRWRRAVLVPADTVGQTCTVLDGAVYAHAGGEFPNDLRLYSGMHEIPFAVTESETDRAEADLAEVRNLRTEGEAIVFELSMPRRPYTTVELLLNAQDFVGSASVWGVDSGGREFALGTFSVLDLASQHLSRSLTLPLQESTFPLLHVQLRLRSTFVSGVHRFPAGIVTGASVPPSRSAQTLYTTVASSTGWQQHGQDSVTTILLPAHIPVARVEFSIPSEYRENFLRNVAVSAQPLHSRGAADDSDVETWKGEISQVHLHLPGGSTADSREASMEAVLAANLREPAIVTVDVANGGETPLPLRQVALQMRQRRLCFEAAAAPGSAPTAYTLMYGDKDLPAPVYEYERSFVPNPAAALVPLGAEQVNPQFTPLPDTRRSTGRRQRLLRFGILVALVVFLGVILRSMRQRRGGTC